MGPTVMKPPRFVDMEARTSCNLRCAYYCTGNGPAMAYTLTGEVNRPSPDACLRLFQEQGGVLPERSAHNQSG